MSRLLLACIAWVWSSCLAAGADEPVTPKVDTPLFIGKNLTGFTTWLKATRHDDPKRVFRVADGLLHVTGEGFGYLATTKAYQDYRVVLEYKWGKRTDGGKFVRNSGLLLHGTGPDGGANGVWMSCIECQLAQGCVGDLIVIRGKNEKGETIPVRLTSDIALGPDKRPRWREGGTQTVFTNRQLWWNKHDPDFKELLDTRGKNDVESQLDDWTKVECICDGRKLQVFVNGTKVNDAYDVNPSTGKILLQVEGFELFVRRFEVRPLKRDRKE
jgi:hypothetical protein